MGYKPTQLGAIVNLSSDGYPSKQTHSCKQSIFYETLGLALLLLLKICFRGVLAFRPSSKFYCPKGFVSETWHYLFGLHEYLKSHQMALCSKVASGWHRRGQGVGAGGVEMFIWSIDTQVSSQYPAGELQLLVHNLSMLQMRPLKSGGRCWN